MPPFRDDQIFIIAPGSETTLAQLGLPESFTPARYRLRSRMFAAEKEGEYEPVKIRRTEKTEPRSAENGAATTTTADEPQWEEDRISEEDAIWPIRQGRVVDWPCFYALMTHVHNTVNPPFHTPVMLIAEPVWTTKEREKVTQFFFEKFKVPAFALVDAAIAASWAFSLPTALVVDVGHSKADVTCIADFVVQDIGRSLAVPGCGGEAMTQRLTELLSGRKGFTRSVCEQLKKSAICEILPLESDMPMADEPMTDVPANPAAAASTGADGAAPGQKKPSVAGDLPRGPGPDTQVGEEKKLEDDEGVLDIASIVTGGNMTDYLAQKEREKAEKAAAKQQKKTGEAPQAAVNKPAKLPNNKRTRNHFIYEDFALHDAMKKAGMTNRGMADMQSALDDNGPNKRQRTPEPQSAVFDKPNASTDTSFTQADGTTDTSPTGGFKREIEVGLERFQAASGGLLDRLADAIFRTVQTCPEVTKRSELWDSLVIVGNGAKVRGFKEALIHTLQAKYIISPSSATIFTSELPSTFTTPMATGANTPQPQLQHSTSGVNPLLFAATTAQHPHPMHPQQASPYAPQYTTHASQAPTSIKVARIPEYFLEWKECGYDEAVFLGAQVCGKVLFMVDGGVSKGYMTRTDYNEQGPGGIGEVCL